jgi:hypothetical protein
VIWPLTEYSSLIWRMFIGAPRQFRGPNIYDGHP